MRTNKKNGKAKATKTKKTKAAGPTDKSKGPRAKRTTSSPSRRGLNETPDTDSLEDYEEIGGAFDENEVANEANDIEDWGRADDEWTDTLYPSDEEDIGGEKGNPDWTSPDKDNDNTSPEKEPDIR